MAHSVEIGMSAFPPLLGDKRTSPIYEHVLTISKERARRDAGCAIGTLNGRPWDPKADGVVMLPAGAPGVA